MALRDFDRDEVLGAEIDLAQRLIDRSEELRSGPRQSAMSVRALAKLSVELIRPMRLPRLGLHELYLAWITEGFDIGLDLYTEQALVAATPGQALAIGLRLRDRSTEMFFGRRATWLGRAIEASKQLDPEQLDLLVTELEVLILQAEQQSSDATLAPDELIRAHGVAQHARTWLARAQRTVPDDGRRTCDALLRPGSARERVQRLISVAAEVSGGPEWLRLHRDDVSELLESGRALIEPPIVHRYTAESLGDDVLGWIAVHERERMAGVARKEVLVWALCAAIEAHARNCLCAQVGGDAQAQEAIQSAGLSALAYWLADRPGESRGSEEWIALQSLWTADLGDLGTEANACRRDLKTAGEIRNRVHHEPRKLTEGAPGILRSMIEPGRPNLLTWIPKILVRRRK